MIIADRKISMKTRAAVKRFRIGTRTTRPRIRHIRKKIVPLNAAAIEESSDVVALHIAFTVKFYHRHQ
jgi:hypothetical protein